MTALSIAGLIVSVITAACLGVWLLVLGGIGLSYGYKVVIDWLCDGYEHFYWLLAYRWWRGRDAEYAHLWLRKAIMDTWPPEEHHTQTENYQREWRRANWWLNANAPQYVLDILWEWRVVCARHIEIILPDLNVREAIEKSTEEE